MLPRIRIDGVPSGSNLFGFAGTREYNTKASGQGSGLEGVYQSSMSRPDAVQKLSMNCYKSSIVLWSNHFILPSVLLRFSFILPSFFLRSSFVLPMMVTTARPLRSSAGKYTSVDDPPQRKLWLCAACWQGVWVEQQDFMQMYSVPSMECSIVHPYMHVGHLVLPQLENS